MLHWEAMRLSDFGDWRRLRRHLAEPWAFLRTRHDPPPAPAYDIPMRDGGSVRLRNAPQDRHILHRIFARDEYRLDGVAPGSWDTVVDVGAHIGLFAVRAAPLARRVLSLEPSDDNYALLVENVRRFPQVEPRRVAVAAQKGTAKLFRAENPSAYSMFGRGTPVEVETIPLDEVLSGVERCDFLKLDCEGAEYDILLSLSPELWPRVRRVALEYHPVAGRSAAELADRLRASGFRVEILPSKKPDKGHLFADRT